MFSNRKGFSLIELMITVSLIGILAAIGIPSYSKFRIKAYQSEAKSHLANLYVAQKSFHLQYNSYYSSLTAIGFAPMGRVRYNIGFGAFDTTVTTDYAIPPWESMATKTICTGAGGVGTDTRCDMIVETPNIENSSVVSQNSFTAGAVSYEDLMLAQQLQANPTLINMAHLMVLSMTTDVQAQTSAGGTTGTVPSSSATKCRQQTQLWVDAWGIDQNKNVNTKKIAPMATNVAAYLFNREGCENDPQMPIAPMAP